MSSSKIILFEHVMRTAQHESLPQRVKLYRALADYSGDDSQVECLTKLASELEAVNQRCFAFERQFQSPPPGGNPA